MPKTINKKESLNELLKKYSGEGVILDLEKQYSSKGTQDLSVKEIKDNEFLKTAKLSETLTQSAFFELRNKSISPLILVRKIKDGWEIVLGRKYYLGAVSNKMSSLPTIEIEIDDLSMLLTLIRFISRQTDRNVIELGLLINVLKAKYNYTYSQISRLTNLSVSQIANIVRLTKLPQNVIDLVSLGILSFGHAKVISNLDATTIKEVVERILEEKLSVRQLEFELSASVERIPGIKKIRESGLSVTIEFESDDEKNAFLLDLKKNNF